MTAEVIPGREVVLETDRLLLRPWRVAEAVVQRELWAERDPRVPPHRRIDAAGHPTVAELEEAIRAGRSSSGGLLAVERKAARDVIGYCGLIHGGRGFEGEPELAFELLRRAWGRGYATEAATAVLDWARSSGFVRLWATVWEWNTASRRVLDKLGFTEAGRKEEDAVHGTTLVTTKRL
ncbi:GNAT family N-acetyltransferase [Amycolatopsis sp. NPDC051371]|uniref:GNAT family N-acetyltransferase n=1 Tax=Amycolatopsis sp. NPDC051371 TaxID=3155800 RepID=UPI003445A5EE